MRNDLTKLQEAIDQTARPTCQHKNLTFLPRLSFSPNELGAAQAEVYMCNDCGALIDLRAPENQTDGPLTAMDPTALNTVIWFFLDRITCAMARQNQAAVQRIREQWLGQTKGATP